MLRLNCLFPMCCWDEALGHIFLSLCQGWQGSEVKARIVVPSTLLNSPPPYLVEAIPRLLRWYYYRNGDQVARKLAGKRFLKDMRNFDAAYIWPGSLIENLQSVKQMGKPIFLERINCYTGKAAQILDDAYRKLGVTPQHLNNTKTPEKELLEVGLADFIFCPSPEVKQSFQEAGVPKEKLLLTSYGWSPHRFPRRPVKQSFTDGEITVLFVGYICVRKGAHLLLQAWERAGLRGKLVLCGRMEPVIAETCKDILNRSDVIHQEYNLDIGTMYQEADVFAFPSLEEGSPLVAYEAMAHGLPMLVSSMGSGGVVRDGVDGMIIPPYDTEQWIEALQRLAASADLRAQFSISARQRAEEFTWDQVANRRAALMVEKLRGQ